MGIPGRYKKKKYANQLGKQIPDPGAHMSHVVVGLIRKHRTKKDETKENLKGGSKQDPRKEYNPYPVEFTPGSL